MKKVLSIITLTYNKLKEGTKPYLDSLCMPENSEIIIVDNGSTDGTVEFLKEYQKSHENVKVIYNSENLGFSGGCNQGIKIAEGEILGFLNNDIILQDNWFEPIKEIFEKEPNAGFVSANPVESEEFPFRYFKRTVKDNILISKESYTPVILPSFSCCFAKKSLLDEIGLFDEKFYPAYFEDDDIAWRAILAGYKNFMSNYVYFYHKGALTGKSFNKLNDIMQKNKEYFFEKYSDKYFIQCNWKIYHYCLYLNSQKIKRRNRSILYRIGRFLKLISCKKPRI